MEIKKSPKADLENKKFLFREIGLIAALAVVFLAFEWKTYEKQANSLGNQDALIVEEEMIPITREPPPPPPEIPKEPIVSDFLEIVDDDVKIDYELTINTEDNKDMGVDLGQYVYGTGTYRGDDGIYEDEIPFAIVEEKPKFRGGDENNFSKWVGQNIVYPEVAKENGVQGKVTLSFVVGTDGRVTEVTVLRGIDPALDKEAVRIVSSSPLWTPGRQRDKPVKVRYNFPVIFQLR